MVFIMTKIEKVLKTIAKREGISVSSAQRRNAVGYKRSLYNSEFSREMYQRVTSRLSMSFWNMKCEE